jgi:hypothetical protein
MVSSENSKENSFLTTFHRFLHDENSKISKIQQNFNVNWLWSQINARSSIRLTVSRQIDFKELDKYIWKPSQIKYWIKKKFSSFSSLFFVLTFRRLNLFHLHCCTPTSCQRLGPCLSTPSRSWRSWSLPALKNRPSVTSTWTWKKL